MKLQNLFKKNMGMDKIDLNKNILHNKYLLYVIFLLSFGNFFMEMMNGNMEFVAVYILIGFLTSFFNKNMIVVLSIAVIFANILKYGRAATVEGFEDDESTLDKLLNIDTSINEENDDDKDSKPKKKCDLEEEEEESEKKKKKKKEGLKQYTEQDMDNMDYEKTEELMKNQKEILKQMKEYKPFLDTIQGLAKNVSTMVNSDEYD